jgi:molybdate transport system permease protein
MIQSRPRQRVININPLWPAGMAATALYVAFIGLPLLALALQAVAEEQFLSSLASPIVFHALQLSAITTTASLVIIVAVGTPLGYLLARKDNPFLRIVDFLIELPIVLPPVVAGVALLMAFGRNGLLGPALESMGITLPFTTIAVLFAQVFVSAPFYIRAARLGFQAVEQSYEDVSQTLGVSPWRTFWMLSLPLTWPALLSGMALSWTRALSEFGATIMFAGNFMGKTQTIPLAILSAMESDIPAALAISVLAVTVSVLALLALGFASRRVTRRTA